METTNLNKTLQEIFQSQYIVPLYQRNFAWGVDEIVQLLQDLYESFEKTNANKQENTTEANYFIGSLVVLKRKDGYLEVIDGQQRLTTLSLLLKILDLVKEPKLFYESRPEVEAFFDSFYHKGNAEDVTFNHKVSHLVDAVDLIKETIINPSEKKQRTLFEIENFNEFKQFLFNNVILLRVEMPQDTDVAAYFEIMNNRGDQLQKHEILKSYLMEELKNEKGEFFEKQQDEFSKIWDACSQMDTHIQRLFSTEDRSNYFDSEYDNYLDVAFDDSINKSAGLTFTIDSALEEETTKNVNRSKSSDVDDAGDDQSIIDFPNFLMHIFKLKYKTFSDDGKETEIPLNEKDLISVYEGLKDKIDAIDFIKDLLYYRTVLDRYIIKSSLDENQEDNYRWSLQKPYKYTYSRDERYQTSLNYKNTFDDQERLIKSLSLLQVTFRSKKYKNWLQDILKFFSDKQNFLNSIDEYQKAIDSWLLNYFDRHISISDYNQGVRVPHFLFNFIDYLYWVESINNKEPSKYNFHFKYRNSVEHHLPQSYNKADKWEYIDSLGNLCLVSRSSNSKMNDESPVGKAEKGGKFYKATLPPKQKMMYDLTNKESKWESQQIEKHYEEVKSLLENIDEILFSTELSLEPSL